MKAFILLALLARTTSAQASVPAHEIALPAPLEGEWRENCIRVIDQNANEPLAPFVQFKMVLSPDGKIEHNYSYYNDDKCTKRKSQKHEYANYKVLEASGHKAKLLVRKDLGDGVISESIVQLTLPKSNGLEVKTLSTKIELDDLLSENPLAGVDKNAGSGESVKKLTRSSDAPKSGTKKI